MMTSHSLLPVGQDISSVGSSTKQDIASSSDEPATRFAWQAVCDDFDFLRDSWAQIGNDGSVRVGIFPARSEARMLRAIHLPKVRDVVG